MGYVYRGTKLLRCGYTTGTCAASAARAAALMLLTQKGTDHIDVTLPKGVKLDLGVKCSSFDNEHAVCCVIKDSGDDPDVTDGTAIFAEVRFCESGIEITGGEGIGKVTMPGLDRPVGDHAINTVPREMIKANVLDIAEKYGYRGGFHVKIYAPDGAELAKRTYNPRMGIVGGISIIGTTGIVEPMSDKAVIDTIRTEANIRKQSGDTDLFLSVGNYSEKFIHEHYPHIKDRCVMCSNFIGDALDIGVSLGFERILLTGHIGKMVKLGSGIMNTHSSYADGRMETLICCAALCGAEKQLLERISDCVTVDGALDIFYEETEIADKVLGMLSQRVQHYVSARVKDMVPTGTVIFSFRHDVLLLSGAAEDILDNRRQI